ncbi:MAG: TonB-dependent receptor [Ignavibacteriales bacterium]
MKLTGSVIVFSKPNACKHKTGISIIILMRIILKIIVLHLLFCGLSVSQSQSGKLQGFVADRKTSLKLPDVNIIISGSGKGISTNLRGYFEIELPGGNYTVQARMMGYEPVEKMCTILPNEKTSLFFELDQASIKTEEVSVISSKYEDIKSKGYELQPGDLKNIPQFGEADPFRALFALPGVTSINDISNQLYVRGGNFDETMVSLDGVPVYNTYHLGGIFSSINSDIISKEKIYLSNYPLSAGGSLSGILDLTTKTGRSDEYRTSASIGLISSRACVEGPLIKGTFTAAARRTYLDALNLISNRAIPYYFYDGYTKYSLPINGKNLFSASAFYSKDVLLLGFNSKNENVSPYWGNLLLNTQWTHLLSGTGSINVKLFLSNFFMGSKNENSAVFFDNLISDLTLKTDYELNEKEHEFKAGAEYKVQKLSYAWNIGSSGLRDYINPPEEAFFDYAPNPFKYNASENTINFYATDEIKIKENFLLRLGLRGSYLGKMDHFFPSFSAGTDYKLSGKLTLSINYGRYYQFLYTIKDNRPESIYAPFAVYFLSDSKNSTSSSDHYSAGINITGMPLETELDIEAYYKSRANLASSYNDYPRYRFEKGYASGMDLLLKKEKGTLSGWIGYSFGRSVKNGDEYSYYANYDRRHTVKILLNCQLSEKWKLSAFWTYASGTPYTDIIGKYLGGYDERIGISDSYINSWGSPIVWRPIDGPKNQMRTEDHHRLDLGITGSFIWGGFLVSPYLQVLNAYNNPNYVVVSPNLQEGGSSDTVKFQNSFIIPTLGVGIEF